MNTASEHDLGTHKVGEACGQSPTVFPHSVLFLLSLLDLAVNDRWPNITLFDGTDSIIEFQYIDQY